MVGPDAGLDYPDDHTLRLPGAGRAVPDDHALGQRLALPQLYHAPAAGRRRVPRVPAQGDLRRGEGGVGCAVARPTGQVSANTVRFLFGASARSRDDPKAHPRADLAGKTIDIHSHAGIQMREAAQISFPYCSSVEDLAYRQRANGVDAAVVFPIAPALFFDLHLHRDRPPGAGGEARSRPRPTSARTACCSPTCIRFCPSTATASCLSSRSIPGRLVTEQLAICANWSRISRSTGSRSCRSSAQIKVTELLVPGRRSWTSSPSGTGRSCSTSPSARAKSSRRR